MAGRRRLLPSPPTRTLASYELVAIRPRFAPAMVTAVRPAATVRVRSLYPLAPDLWPHQRSGIEWIRPRRRALLADEMALGKSRLILQALDLASRTLICCPASVVPTWREQIGKWRPDLRWGRGPLRRPAEGEIIVLSDDSLPSASGRGRSLTGDPLGDVTVVIDEVHRCKGAGTERTRSMRRLVHQAGRAWGLTGTPMPGGPPDFWGVLSTLELQRSFGSAADFLDLFGAVRKGRGAYAWGEVSTRLAELLAPIMLRRLRRDVLPDLPTEQEIEHVVPVPEDLAGFFDAARDTWEAEGKKRPPNPEAMRALAAAKTPAALELIKDVAATMPVVVFSAHRDPVIEAGSLPGAGWIVGGMPAREQARTLSDFRKGRLRILAMTIDVGGTGIDGLQEVAGGVVFIDRDYTPGLNDQAKARVLRPGQKRPSVCVWYVISDHPLDRRLSEILGDKQRVIGASVG